MRLASKVIFFTSLGAEPQSQYLFTGVLGVLGALSGRDGIGSRTGVAGSRLNRTVVPTLGVRLGRRRDGALGFHILPTKLFMALHVVDVVVRLACISLAVSAMLTTLPVLNSAFLVSCSNFACMSSIAACRSSYIPIMALREAAMSSTLSIFSGGATRAALFSASVPENPALPSAVESADDRWVPLDACLLKSCSARADLSLSRSADVSLS